MRTSCVKNGLAVGVILLFIGIAVQPSVATVQPEKEIDVEPKDFLFQTIIDIANNPEVKNLLEHYNHRMFTSDYDYKGVFSQLFFRKPRLLFNVLFTKPSMTYDYLDKCYKRGIEITNILGEDRAIEMIESIKVTNPEVLDDLNNIITNDEELSKRLAKLEEMNKELKLDTPWQDHPIICSIMGIILIFTLIYEGILSIISTFFIYMGFYIIPYIVFAILIIPEVIIFYSIGVLFLAYCVDFDFGPYPSCQINKK